jgi:hypothetical protein
MKLIKKCNQVGALSLHILIPAVLVIAAIGGIGAYVIRSSSAAPSPNIVCKGQARDRVQRGDSFKLTFTCKNSGNAEGKAYALGYLINKSSGKEYYESGVDMGVIVAGDSRTASISYPTSKSAIGSVLPLGEYKIKVINWYPNYPANPTSTTITIYN